MDDIVEKFLIEKLGQEIIHANEAAKLLETKSACKTFPVQKEWKNLHDMLTEQSKSESGDKAAKDTRREKLYYLLNLMAEWHELLNKQQCLVPKSLFPVDDITVRLRQVKNDLEEAHKTQQHQPKKPELFPEVYRCSSKTSLTEIRGFQDKGMIMERLLLQEGSKAIGIVGVAGVGKTALCQFAYRKEKVQDQFPFMLWLCLSMQQKIDDPEVKRKLSCLRFEDQVKKMLSSLGFEDNIISSIGEKNLLEVALRRQLSRGRFLVVLDDVWIEQEDMLEEDVMMVREIQKLYSFLTKLDPSVYKGTVIVTSRSTKLEEMVGPKNMQRLLHLADDESCWEIFTDAFYEDGKMVTKKSEREKMLKPKIVVNCAGLPLMAKMLGKIGNLEP